MNGETGPEESMRLHEAGKRATLILALVAMPLLAACSDDDPTGVVDDALLGNWAVTSFTIEGFGDLIAATNLELTMGFTEDSYTFDVTSDDLGIFCSAGTDCSESGDYSISGSSLTFDPGTADAASFTYSISDNTLAATGTVDGDAVTISADKM